MVTKTYQEKQIQQRLAQELPNARTEVHTSVGRADIVTLNQVIEIKNWKFWKFGVGQLIAYSACFPNKTLRLHCFGEIDTPTRLDLIRLFARLPIEIELTWE